MSQIFHPSMNIVARVTIFGGVLILAAIASAAGVLVRSSYVTQVNVVRDQPVPFSHQHHVSELGLDCRYCHTSVETSAFAGMPSSEVCMGCHSQIWNSSPMLAPVRESQRTGKPLQWTRVHDLPDFVYFNHSIHVAKGIGCESCHGRVDEMPLMRRAANLHMEWCLNCHRHPELNVRSASDIYHSGRQRSSANGTNSEPAIRSATPTRKRTGDQDRQGNETSTRSDSIERALTGRQLVEQYQIATRQITDCVVCHR